MGSTTDLARFYNNFAGNVNDDFEAAVLQPASGITMFTPSPSNSSSYSIQSPSSTEDGDLESVQGLPFLEITEQPVPSFRFRYRSEMQGAHGSLLARGDERSRQKCYPSVKLHNVTGDAIVRCSLYSADANNPIPHIHQLITRKLNKDVFDHELTVSERNNFTAEFRGLGIVHVSKKNLKDEIVRKKELTMFEELKRDKDFSHLSDAALKAEVASRRREIEAEAETNAKSVDPNRAKLCFEAFVRDSRGRITYLCDRVFSSSIQNMKSAETCELKICRMDKYMGSCRGGDEVFILVEKVCKKNIQVRFYEEDEAGNEVWHDFATFREYDVHHQYAIVFRTPPYRRDDIEDRVAVKVQLYRPNNNQFSDSLPFEYKPARQYLRKRHCDSVTTSSSLSSMEAKKYCQPSSQEQEGLLSGENLMLSGGLSSFGSLNCPSDTLQHALNQFVITRTLAGDGEFDDLVQFSKTVDLEGYLNIGDTEAQELHIGETEAQELQTFDPFLPVIGSDPIDYVSFDGAAPKSKNTAEVDDITMDGPIRTGPKARSIKKKPQPVDRKSIDYVTEAYARLEELLKSNDSNRNQEIKKLLKAKSHDVGPLHAAVVHGYLRELGNILSLLIKGGLFKFISTVNHLRETPLILAAKKNKADCVKVLLLAGADVNPSDIDQNSALHWAVKNANHTILKELLSHKEYDRHSKRIDLDKPNTYGESPLHLALLMDEPDQKKSELVQLLLDAKCNPDLLYENETPLMLAVQQNDPHCLQLLLKAGADPNASGSKENTVLHLCVECKYHTCLKELLSFKSSTNSKKIDLDRKNEQGETPLHIAIRIMDVTSSKLLIDTGCDVNAKIPTSGNTPLHLAAQYNSKDVLLALINTRRIRPEEENLNGKTALDLAESDANLQEIAVILRKLSFEAVKEEVISDDDTKEVGALFIDEDRMTNVASDINSDISKSHKKGRRKQVFHQRNDECSSSAESKSLSSTKEHSDLFDHKTMEQIIQSLDRDRKWKLLCQKLNCGFLETSITGVPSPTRCLINYIEFEQKITLDEIKDAVEEIGAVDALKAIDAMIVKGKSTKSKRRSQANK